VAIHRHLPFREAAHESFTAEKLLIPCSHGLAHGAKTKTPRMFKRLRLIAAAAFCAGIFSMNAFAGPTATQTITFQVMAINELSVSGSPAAMIVNTATAGLAPDPVFESSTTYAITTNETNRKITGALNSNMPSGMVLAVLLVNPTGATSTGYQYLTTAPVNLVTGISTLNQSGLTIGYIMAATAAAGVVPSATRTVTFTITAG
jgi:hypothetical protein